MWVLPTTEYSGGLIISSYQHKLEVEKSLYKVEKSKFFPEISAGYFNQDIDEINGLDGWQVSLAFPIWFFSQNSTIKQAKINSDIALNNLEYQKFNIEKEVENLLFELNKHFKQIIFYKDHALLQAEQLIYTSKIQYEKEEIDYFEYIQGISTGLKLKMNYLETLNNYNQTAIQLEYYAN